MGGLSGSASDGDTPGVRAHEVRSVQRLLITPDKSVRETMEVIDRGAHGIALLVDAEDRLVAAITDGDIRRAILDGVSLAASVSTLIARKRDSAYPEPITAPVGSDRTTLLQLMQSRSIRQIPLLDEAGRVVELVTAPDLMPREMLPLEAVIMAGGFGKRLRPLTDDTPKPMLPVGDTPLLELIIQQLQGAGIERVNISTHYMPEKISDHFGDGERFGIKLAYTREDRPLGTAGALSLLDAPDQPLLVINGDVLTRIDFRSMLEFHKKQDAALTVAVRQYDLSVPYGVLECDGPRVRRIREKPTYNFFINAGVYLLNPSAHGAIPSDRTFDMTDLVEVLLEEGEKVVSFPVVEYWMDIGQAEDYKRAQQDMEAGRLTS